MLINVAGGGGSQDLNHTNITDYSSTKQNVMTQCNAFSFQTA